MWRRENQSSPGEHDEHWFLSLAEAREKSEAWRRDYNQVRPHSALEYQAPEGFAEVLSGVKPLRAGPTVK